MIVYTIFPLELVFEGYEDFKPEYEEIERDGCRLLVEALSFNQGKIVRLISSNPQDYLNPAYQPGEIIKFKD